MEATLVDHLYLVQGEAEMYIKSYCRKRLDHWSKYLENANIETGFVDLQLRILNYSFRGRVIPVPSYEVLFEDKNELRQRQTLIISGEAGCGKSTYVEKLASDWAHGNLHLRNQFDLVLIYDSSSWRTSVRQGLEHIFSADLRSVATQLLENSNKILIICDINMTSLETEDTSFIRSILKKETYPNVTVMVTTQVQGFRHICPEFVSIDGFSETGVSNYMKIHNCKIDDNEDLIKLLQLPLCSALYCTLQKAGYSTWTATDLFDLIKCYVDHSLQKHCKTTGTTFTEENINETLMAIGKYSLVHLVDTSMFSELNDLKSVVSENHFDCESLKGCNLDNGLFTKTKIGNEYQVLHQSVADYLAAYYIANVLNLELNFAGESCPWLKTHLAEFVCYHILLMWEEGKFGDKSVTKFLEDDGICFLWFCKRPSAFKHLSVNYIDRITGLGPPNNWSSPRLVKWMKNLRFCPNLPSFDMSNGNLSQDAWKAFVDVLNSGSLPHLNKVHLKYDFTIGNEVSFFKSLGKLKIITYVKFSKCGLTPEAVDAVVEEMNSGNLSNVERFFLTDNIEVGQQSSIFSALTKCPKLHDIAFDCCDITATSIKCFTDGINENCFPNLYQISISQNRQIGGVVKFFSNLAKLPNLGCLTVIDCDIQLACLQALADDMKKGKFAKLDYLNVSCNANVGQEMTFIKALGFCEKLDCLEIHTCNLPAEAVHVLNMLRGRGCQVFDVTPEDWDLLLAMEDDA